MFVGFRPLSGAVRFSVIALDGLVQTEMDLVSGFCFLDSIRTDVRIYRHMHAFSLFEVISDGRGTCTVRPYTIESDAFFALMSTSVPRRPPAYRLLLVKPLEKVSARVWCRPASYYCVVLRNEKNGTVREKTCRPTPYSARTVRHFVEDKTDNGTWPGAEAFQVFDKRKNSYRTSNFA